MVVQHFMFEIEGYHISFPIDDLVTLLNKLEAWLKQPDVYYVVLVKDFKLETFTSQEPIGEQDQKLSFYFFVIERMWCCTISEITEMVERTRESIRIATHDALLWRLSNAGIACAEFDYPSSEYVN